MPLGKSLGETVGEALGLALGLPVGLSVGFILGLSVGLPVGLGVVVDNRLFRSSPLILLLLPPLPLLFSVSFDVGGDKFGTALNASLGEGGASVLGAKLGISDGASDRSGSATEGTILGASL